jgi:hypothetical protein
LNSPWMPESVSTILALGMIASLHYFGIKTLICHMMVLSPVTPLP